MVGRARRARRNERNDNSRVATSAKATVAEERVERVEVLDRIDFGLCGVVGGMMVIEMLACAMRRGRVVFAAVDRQ